MHDNKAFNIILKRRCGWKSRKYKLCGETLTKALGMIWVELYEIIFFHMIQNFKKGIREIRGVKVLANLHANSRNKCVYMYTQK